MWVLNVILIFVAIAFTSWLLLGYGDELGKALGVVGSGCQSVLFALGVVLLEAFKAACVAALASGAFGLIFFVAGAPRPTIKAVAVSIASLTFTLLVLKALWENLNNLRWSIRNEIRNRYRRR
jgi:predicted signal transduction protein with EAL and GGDEF domain